MTRRLQQPFREITAPRVNPLATWGYSWLFGRSDGDAIGSGICRDGGDRFPTWRKEIRPEASRFGIRERPRFINWVIPSHRPRPAALGNVALVGDVRGTADPLYVERS